MEKLLTQKTNNTLEHHLLLDDIEKFYLPKKIKQLSFGLEYERLSLDKDTLKCAQYSKMEKIIENFAHIEKWELIFDKTNIIGAISKTDFASISLEPGCQMEISLPPYENIIDIENKLSKITNLLDKIAIAYNVIFLGYGISPYSAVDEIEIIKKQRYEIMDKFLPNCINAELCPKMMRQTAGMQVNIDYYDEADAYNKLYFFNLIMPFVSGLFANSPIDSNHITTYKSARVNVWRFCGANRCQIFYKNIFNKLLFKHNNIFKNYINEVINVPMVYIVRDDKNIQINGKITFKEFMKYGFNSYSATYDDYILHQSLCFPDVRLKNYIEIRNHDSSNPKMSLALCALYKGLCLSGICELIKKFNYLKFSSIDDYNKNIIVHGLDYKINNSISGWDVVKDIFNASKNSLNAIERSYLSPINEMIKNKKTQSDIIVDYNYKNAKELVSYLYE